MKEWLEQGGGVLLVAVVAGVGFMNRMILFGYYGRMYKECKKFETSRQKAIVYIREDLKRRKAKGQEIRNTMTYTECRMAEWKVFGIRCGWLENRLLYSNLFVLLCGIMAAFAGAMLGCEKDSVLFMLFISGGIVLGLLAVDMVLDLHDKYKRIRLLLRDYIENNWSVLAEWREDNLMPEELQEQAMKIKEKQVRGKKAISKDKPVNAKAGKKGKAQEEKRRLTEELLRERRQLEARTIAELQKKEQAIPIKEETVLRECEPVTSDPEPAMKEIEQVQEEAAVTVTERTYELLMSEVLAEYLA